MVVMAGSVITFSLVGVVVFVMADSDLAMMNSLLNALVVNMAVVQMMAGILFFIVFMIFGFLGLWFVFVWLA